MSLGHHPTRMRKTTAHGWAKVLGYSSSLAHAASSSKDLERVVGLLPVQAKTWLVLLLVDIKSHLLIVMH